jgi:hypothetical protein
MQSKENFRERPFAEEQGGFYDEAGFYITKNGDFWDPDGVYFNKNGFDKHGGFYDENLVYKPGKGWNHEMQCYEDEIVQTNSRERMGGSDNRRRGNNRRRNDQNNYEEYEGVEGDENEEELAEVFGFDIEKIMKEEDDKFCKKTFETFFKNKDSLVPNPSINNFTPKVSDAPVTNTVNSSTFSRKVIESNLEMKDVKPRSNWQNNAYNNQSDRSMGMANRKNSDGNSENNTDNTFYNRNVNPRYNNNMYQQQVNSNVNLQNTNRNQNKYNKNYNYGNKNPKPETRSIYNPSQNGTIYK